MNDAKRNQYIDAYTKAEGRLLEVYREITNCRTNSEIERISWKIRHVAHDMMGSTLDLSEIYEAIRALEMAAGVQKIKGGYGSRAYEKITDLGAMARYIRDNPD